MSKWELVDERPFGLYGHVKVITERIEVGKEKWLYRDVIQVYEHLNWKVQDIKYAVVD